MGVKTKIRKIKKIKKIEKTYQKVGELRGFLKKRVNLKRNRETKETCIFCQEEYLRETLWEDVDKQQPNILQVSICKSCHACLKDDVVMKEIRETIKKSSCKLDEANKKAE